jgi:hypothetical protein
MEESYTEGLANHGGPKPCVDDPQGRGEASVAVRAGQLLSPEMGLVQGADTVMTSGRQYRRRRYRKTPSDPAGSKNLCTHGTSIRENWEIPCLPVQLIGGGSPGEGQVVLGYVCCEQEAYVDGHASPSILRTGPFSSGPSCVKKTWWRLPPEKSQGL